MDKFQPEVVRSFHQHGCRVVSTPTVDPRKMKYEEPARADLFVGVNGRAAWVEIKNGSGKGAGKSFKFGDWRENQREWAAEVRRPPSSTEYWLALLLGEHPPSYNPEKYQPRQMWLVPHDEWLEVEKTISPIQDSIPYRATKGYNRILQDESLDAMTLLRHWALKWSSGFWSVPEKHPFHELYIAQTPILYYRSEAKYAS